MKRSHRCIPSVSDRLESRVVPSHGSGARGLSVVVGGLAPREQVLSRAQQPVIAEVTQAFNSFQSDYDQARATYFASILSQTSGSSAASSANTAFTLLTAQRVELLAAQLVSSFLQQPQGTSNAKGQMPTIKGLIASKIIDPQGKNGPTGLLYRSLTSSIPPAGASASTESLYTLSQDDAIAAAEVTVINAVNITKNGDFGNHYNKHPN
jgi:hypothetical protein